MKNKFTGIALALLAGGALVSCTNELNEPGTGGNGSLSSPVARPDLVTWSGSQNFTNTLNKSAQSAIGLPAVGNAIQTRGLVANESEHWGEFSNIPSFIQRITGRCTTIEENVGINAQLEEQYPELVAAIRAKTNGSRISENIVFPWENYFLQDIYSTNGFYNLKGYDSHAENDYVMITNSATINSHCQLTKTQNLALLYGMGVSDYESMKGKQFRFDSDNLTNCTDYIVVEVNGVYYICIDSIDAQTKHQNFDYMDWILVITPAIPVSNPDFQAEIWTGAPSNDGVGGGGSGGTEGGVGDGSDDSNGSVGGGSNGGDNNGGNNGNTGNNGSAGNKTVNEVEINLALLDVHVLPNGSQKYDIADLVSKLSIHVRYPKDVEVILPVPEKFYCNQDDLYILKDHYYTGGQPNWEYGGETVTYQNFVGQHNVSLTVEYVSAANDELTGRHEGYIRVYTQGINEDVIKYCRENFGDGINFEVFNYYNRGTMYTTGSYAQITYEDLQWQYLNRSLVNFDWRVTNYPTKTYPDFYINAFNQIDGEYNPGDCYVWIMGDHHAKYNSSIYEGGKYDGTIMHWSSESQDLNVRPDVEKNYYWNAYQGVHYNASPYNWIYTNRSVVGSVNPSGSNAMPDTNGWPFN